MINLLKPPIFDDEDKTIAAHQIFIIAWAFIIFGWLPLLIAIFTPETLYRWLITTGVMESSGFIVLVLNKYGYTRLAGNFTIFVVWLTTTTMVLTGGGLSSNAMSMYIIVVLIAGLVKSGKSGFLTAVICSLTALIVVYIGYIGALPKNRVSHTPLTLWISFTVYMGIAISLQYLVSGTIRKALKQSRHELNERKRAEDELLESGERYRTFVENASDIIFRTDNTGHFTFVNPAALSSTGYKEEEVIGMHYPAMIRPDMRDEAIKLFGRQFVKGINNTYSEFPVVAKDGHEIWFGQNTQLIVENGNVTGFQSLARDITQRIRAQEALNAAEESYRNIFMNSQVGLYRTDIKTGIMIEANDKLAQAIGYKNREELLSGNFNISERYVDAEARNEVFALLKEHGQINNYETQFKINGGEIRWVRFSAKVVPAKGWLEGVSEDITDRKQVQEALRESEERYRGILAEMDEAYGEVDLKGRFTFFNESMCETLGYSRVELLGMDNRAYTTPEQARKAFQTFSEIYRTGLPKAMMDYEIIRKSGEKRILETSILPIKKLAGEIIGFRCVSRDVSERIKAEEAQRILEERLQQADKMESIGTLAGGIAHDFNNLLTGIQGYVSMTVMNLKDNDPNYERLQRIQDQVQSGGDLTRQLLGFARGGRYEIKPSDMNEILEKTSSLFGRTKKEISIQRKPASDLWVVEVDRGQMEQVFMNLYVNASQAMPGGGDIYLETQNAFLNDEQNFPYFIQPGKYVKITVTDTGTGMDEKTREKIFEPFFTTKAMGRGTGLGLATVYGIIKGHGGMINVYSEPGHGTTFTIYLPASEKQVVQEDEQIDEIVPGTETILLIDDEKVVMGVNKELLESVGYTVYAAGSGQEGLAVYMEKKDKIDLIILDMIMPGISGSDTFDRLRQINPKAKVLLSSGYSLTGKAQAIMDRGCNGFIQKPFRLEELSSKIREMLN